MAAFPYWESQAIGDAIDYLYGEMEPVFEQANGKPFVLGETGWPSNGTSAVSSVASPENQVQYFVNFFCRMDEGLGWAYYYFTGLDNGWRSDQDGQEDTVEAHFGLLNADLTLKSHFQDLVFTCIDSGNEYIVQLGSSGGEPTAQVAPAPVPSPVAAPTAADRPSAVASPTTSNGAVTQCAAYTDCAARGLAGQCCPTVDGVYLACCDGGLLNGATDENDDDGTNDDNGGDDDDNDEVAAPTTSPGKDAPDSPSPTLGGASDTPSSSPVQTFASESPTWDRDASSVQDNSGAMTQGGSRSVGLVLLCSFLLWSLA